MHSQYLEIQMILDKGLFFHVSLILIFLKEALYLGRR